MTGPEILPPPGCSHCDDCYFLWHVQFAPDAACSCGHRVDEHTKVVDLDFREVQEELDNVLLSISEKLAREWPRSVGNHETFVVVLGMYRVSWFSYRAMRYLSATAKINFDPKRLPEFVTAMPPIARSILDAIANVVYIFEGDVTERTNEYLRRGWGEDYRHFLRDRERHGHEPAWADVLARLEARLEEVRVELTLPVEARDKLPRRWPNLGTMMSDKDPDRVRDPQRRELLAMLKEMYWEGFSGETHLSGPGLYRRAGLLLNESRLWDDADRAVLDRLRTEYLMGGSELMLSLAAELEAELQLGMAERLVRIWVRLSYHSTDMNRIYKTWVRDRLVPPMQQVVRATPE